MSYKKGAGMDVSILPECQRWLKMLKDAQARHRIIARIVRIREGNFGNVRRIDAGLSELKIDYGPGYRVYFTIDSGRLVVLLCGGDKSTQGRDIERAGRLLEERGWRK